MAIALSMSVFDNANWFYAVADVAGESATLAFYKNNVAFHPDVVVWYQLPDCLGNAYVLKIDYDNTQPFSLLNPFDYIVGQDGISVLKRDSTLLPDWSAMSKLEIDAADSIFKCSNANKTGDMYELQYLGDLPASTPPYSIARLMN